MNILGIIAFGENPAACVLKDGKIVALAEEERFTRLKGSEGMFPKKAISYCLKEAKISLQEVYRIAFGWDCKKYPWAMGASLVGNAFRGRSGAKRESIRKDSFSVFKALETLMEYEPNRIQSLITVGLREAGLKGEIPEIVFVPHHLAHAYSAFYSSPFNKAGVLTLDGSGENISTQLSLAENATIKVVEQYEIPNSLGWFYAAITQYLGFLPYRDEGKLMGLAALGEERKGQNIWIEPLSKVLSITENSYKVNPVYTKWGGHYWGDRFTDEFRNLLTAVDPRAEPIAYGEKCIINGEEKSKYLLELYVDIAWAAQDLLERAAVMLARKLVNKYGVENICVAGGVALNCKMNGEILRQSGCKNIFVQPAASDSGTALGAAMFVAQSVGDKIHNPLKQVYYGPGFSNKEVEDVLRHCGVSFIAVDNPAQEAANLLEQGNVIAWFQERMEYGARALGNRSILANPVIKNIKNKVNRDVKYREMWRPFCPSILDKKADNYIKNKNEASFMIVAYHVTEEAKKNLPAIVHVDGTIRPQVVTNEMNALYYNLLESLGQKTGHPVVLNTSFNVRSEPIICNPLEAIRCFYSNGLDALIMGNYLLKKNKNLS